MMNGRRTAEFIYESVAALIETGDNAAVLNSVAAFANESDDPQTELLLAVVGVITDLARMITMQAGSHKAALELARQYSLHLQVDAIFEGDDTP